MPLLLPLPLSPLSLFRPELALMLMCLRRKARPHAVPRPADPALDAQVREDLLGAIGDVEGIVKLCAKLLVAPPVRQESRRLQDFLQRATEAPNTRTYTQVHMPACSRGKAG